MNTKEEFNLHLKTWREQTRFVSSSTEIVINPSYRKIISMGALAVPYLLAEIKKEPHLSFALHAITGDNPVKNVDRGDAEAIARAWIEWGVLMRKRKLHTLKTETEYYQAFEQGLKGFEVRRNDRDFQVGDIVILVEVFEGKPSGRESSTREIVYIFHGGKHGLESEYCVFSHECTKGR